MSPDGSYHVRRANQERRLAMASADLRARRVHLEMAARYAALAGADPDGPEAQNAVAERLWAAALRRALA